MSNPTNPTKAPKTLATAPTVLLANDAVAFRLASKSARSTAPRDFQVVDLTVHPVDIGTIYHGSRGLTPAFIANLPLLMLRDEVHGQLNRVLRPEYLAMVQDIMDGKHGKVKQWNNDETRVVSATEHEAVQRADALERRYADLERKFNALMARQQPPASAPEPTLSSLVGSAEPAPAVPDLFAKLGIKAR